MANRPLRDLTRYTNFRFQRVDAKLQRLKRSLLGHSDVRLLLKLRLGLGESRRDLLSCIQLHGNGRDPHLLLCSHPVLQRFMCTHLPKIGLKYFNLWLKDCRESVWDTFKEKSLNMSSKCASKTELNDDNMTPSGAQNFEIL